MKKLPHRLIRLIVTGVSLAAGLLIGGPLVEEYMSNRERIQEVERLQAEHAQLQQQRETLGLALQKSAEQFSVLSKRSTTSENQNLIRDQLVGIVRDTGCQLRQIETTEGNRRAWGGESDDPTRDSATRGMAATEFDLQTSRLGLTVSGSLDAVRELIHRISDLRLIALVEQVAMQPADGTGRVVQLELRMKLFGLQLREKDAIEDIGPDAVAQLP